MTFKPNLSVKEGLDHLARRLDPILQSKLDSRLNGDPWTLILEALDNKSGSSRNYRYERRDLQAQLKILTQRLGSWDYPLDDKDRTVSTLGQELRIVRNQNAHMYEFTTAEAFRANDFCVRLLEYFGDSEGKKEAAHIRQQALVALALEQGITQAAAKSETATEPVKELVSEPATPSEPEEELVTPDDSVMAAEPTVIGDRRLVFEPWSVVTVGGVEVLDDLPKKAAKEKVRAVAVEIANFEGPVALDRLVDLTVRSFGMQRVMSNRAKKVMYQIRQAGLVVDDDKFVWPQSMDPGTWTGFRPNDSTADRPFGQISPVEIANAARFIKGQQPQIAEADLDIAVLQTFGRRRRTKPVVAQLEKAKRLAEEQ